MSIVVVSEVHVPIHTGFSGLENSNNTTQHARGQNNKGSPLTNTRPLGEVMKFEVLRRLFELEAPAGVAAAGDDGELWELSAGV
jgi:hypothetical protein